jgi:PiT family inorganic phosphate transporter
VSVDAVHWSGVGPIVASWIVTPLLAGIISFGLFVSVQKLIIDTDNPFLNAKRFVPLYMFITGFVISLMTMTKGLKHVATCLGTYTPWHEYLCTQLQGLRSNGSRGLQH